MPKTVLSKLMWAAIVIIGASAIGGIAVHRGESITPSVRGSRHLHLSGRVSLLQRMICARVLVLDETRASAGGAVHNGRDFVPTNKWVTFGHHSRQSPAPTADRPTLAMQFGYLPARYGSWRRGARRLRAGHVIMFCSTRRRRPQPRPDGAR